MLFVPIYEFGCGLCRRKIPQPRFHVTQIENDAVNASSDLQYGRRGTVNDPGLTSVPTRATPEYEVGLNAESAYSDCNVC